MKRMQCLGFIAITGVVLMGTSLVPAEYSDFQTDPASLRGSVQYVCDGQ